MLKIWTLVFNNSSTVCSFWLYLFHFQLSCCGRDSYTDWFTRAWDMHNPGTSDSVPPSCCKIEGCDSRNLPHPDIAPNGTMPVYTQVGMIVDTPFHFTQNLN